MEYTVHKLAEISGVSGRTLRYYDQIGLLTPARINSSGYRIYGDKEVDRLQQILFYRELEVSLEEIHKILEHPDFDPITALKEHYAMLTQKRDHLEQLLHTVKQTIASKEGGTTMQDKEKFKGLKEQRIRENETKYGDEIREKYGDAEIDESNAKLRGMSETDFNKMKDLEVEIITLLHEAYTTNDPASDQAEQLVAKHKEWLMYSWKTFSKEAYQNLAEMYVADERFTSYYDDHTGSGATKFLRDAILHHTNK
ncbi:MerR family transcriptional regulator [Paenibacillus sp. Marseille-Q4541]|uniref:MerR family transcriptional regulator n=1 Tax=Paenibacillus sp. Marseille-Q4541 TaxID=2831522 RepID=UPI001BADE567|nr:MerR family transcriptional regulator [Paenibacillus sp. Marseille-Q4541]